MSDYRVFTAQFQRHLSWLVDHGGMLKARALDSPLWTSGLARGQLDRRNADACELSVDCRQIAGAPPGFPGLIGRYYYMAAASLRPGKKMNCK